MPPQLIQNRGRFGSNPRHFRSQIDQEKDKLLNILSPDKLLNHVSPNQPESPSRDELEKAPVIELKHIHY